MSVARSFALMPSITLLCWKIQPEHPVQQKDCKRETIQLRRPRPGRAERSQGPMTMTGRVVNRNRKKYKFLSGRAGRRCKQAGRRNRARDSAQTDHIRQVPRWRSPLLFCPSVGGAKKLKWHSDESDQSRPSEIEPALHRTHLLQYAVRT